ncbi:hypothetical protein MNB_ARC-1_290 [hydrothermal vent metagenome]|uniref:Uncharacterized protein n=1 Tax=hydrothermal vent metagenome TaxID=652676 RepID=A0A3B1DR69_9ZZZZ
MTSINAVLLKMIFIITNQTIFNFFKNSNKKLWYYFGV